VQPFDAHWNEGRTMREEERIFHIENGPLDREVLWVETLPIANPNGAGNTIVGRTIWELSTALE
jgi:hypothetical protein